MEFFQIYEMVKKNISYWANSIQINTNFGVDRDDAYQELLIAVFKMWSKKEKLTKFFVQKRLYYANIRILRKYYISNQANLNLLYIEVLQTEEDNTCQYELLDDKYDDNAVLNKIETNNILDKLVYKLGGEGSRANKIAKLIMQSMSVRDIAGELGMKRSNVSKIKQEKIKKTLQSIMNKL